MDEERIPIVEEKFDDYSPEQLEVKKRITEEKIQEIVEYSIPNRIQKKYGIDVYRLAPYLFVIEIIVFIIGMLIIFCPIITNPTMVDNREIMGNSMYVFMIFFFVMILIMMPTYITIFVDRTAPLRRKLREINRVIRIKQEVAQGDKFDLDESETREYKSSFKYDYNSGNPNPNLTKIVVQSILGFLNSNGGTLVIGISDDKKILGIENDLKLFNGSWDKYQLAIQDTIRKHTDTALSDFISIRKVVKEEKQLCLITVKRSPKPVYFNDGDKQELYIRDGNSTINLTTKQAFEYINSHWFDKIR
jgi:hypothetical protein